MRRALGTGLLLLLGACTHDYARLRGGSDGAAAASGGSGATRSGGAGGGGSATGGRGGGTPTDGGSTDAGCALASVTVTAKTPTVQLLVDRSVSMFDCTSTPNSVEPSCPNAADTAWTRLKESALSAVSALQREVRFGFTAFTGTNPASGGRCPILDTVAPALNNHAAIATVYDGLPFPPPSTESGVKFEGPAKLALDAAGSLLMADAGAGNSDKTVLFITDGEPDYCDDGNVLCPPDSVVGALQSLRSKGITTLVLGLQNRTSDLSPGILQSFANAGAGEPTMAPLRPAADIYSFFDQCSTISGWRLDAIATGKQFTRGLTVGTYAASAGPTRPFTPDGSNQAMITSELSRALSVARKCTFDLTGSNGAPVKIDATKAAGARVLVNGSPVAQDSANGWSLATPTEVQLNGAACASVRTGGSAAKVEFEFPCQSISSR